LFRKSYPLVLLKTGYTKTAKHCYAGKIYYKGRQYVFAFLKSRKPWADIDAMIRIIKKQLKK
jgi:D-alanyl-D-alanine carboxypeptidase